jgi:outer membrane receptor protein involved in Fe transport
VREWLKRLNVQTLFIEPGSPWEIGYTCPMLPREGFYGTSCDPVPEFRSIFRVSWARESLDASLLWRHVGSMDAQTAEAPTLFETFRTVDSQNHFDLNIGYSYKDWGRFSFLVRNIADENPPIFGNNTGSTSFNSGNTFPSLFDTMGRSYSINLKVTF